MTDRLLGDEIYNSALFYASRKNESGLFTTLRASRLPRLHYMRYIASMYPIVFGFNAALIRSIIKINHVHHWKLVRNVAQQIREEQSHNQLWRNMLDSFGIDHAAIHDDIQSYFRQFAANALESMTLSTIRSLRSDITNTFPGCFPRAIYPEPVLALYYHLWHAASCDAISYWEYFGSQFGMEAIILDVVSTSVLPGVSRSRELAPRPESVQWWKEHARSVSDDAEKRSVEEKHVHLARLALNRIRDVNVVRDEVVRRADDTMLLFVATAVWHDVGSDLFPIEKYLKKS